MKRLLFTLLLVPAGLSCVTLSVGCAEKKAEITAEKKKQFGTANQPMPPEAREAIMKMTQKGQERPSAAVAVPAKP
ncbi:MAG: hypothetical protein H8F28_00880 [Fibrella sp.]|nr:hypothetical protein [Armatimonadota bacterium]